MCNFKMNVYCLFNNTTFYSFILGTYLLGKYVFGNNTIHCATLFIRMFAKIGKNLI